MNIWVYGLGILWILGVLWILGLLGTLSYVYPVRDAHVFLGYIPVIESAGHRIYTVSVSLGETSFSKDWPKLDLINSI